MTSFFETHPFWARLLFAFVLLLAASFVHGQGAPGLSNYPPTVQPASGAPSGNCTATNSFYINTANGNFYDCPTPGSAWVLAGSVTAGTGTVSANSGSAGALATYAAAGGSTTVGPDAAINSNGTGALTLGAVGAGTGQLTFKGNTSGTQNIQCVSATCTTLSTGAAFSFGSSVTLTGHLNQSAANQWAGSCAMSAATTCTFSIALTFTNYLSFVSIDHVSSPPATANSAVCSLSGTTVTITAGISNSLTWDCLLIGNPN